ncbi:MAG TPA: hypothetical protein GXX47_04680 [Firmicutes bacterium]|nr:hypothetical protein [Bacillota bacterium]
MRPVLSVLALLSAVLTLGLLSLADVKAVSAKGLVELEISRPTEPQDGAGVEFVQGISWQGRVGRLRLPAALELKLVKAAADSPKLDRAQLKVRPAGMEVSIFHNAGFRSTLDPIRLLASSRRAEGAAGVELNGTFGRWSGRGLWISEIENTGDNGPLFLLDISLPPIWNAGKYRYIYLSHDSGWQWHYPKSGPYATRTARQVHSLLGTWPLGRNLRVSGQAAVLKGFDVTRKYRRDLEGLAVISRIEGLVGSLNWGLDAYRTNPGFLLATGDSDSLGPGVAGLAVRLNRSPHRDESLRLSFGVEQPVPEFQELMRLEEADAVKIPGPRSEAELTYRRRLQLFTYRLGFGWEREAGQNSIQITWDTNWPSWKLRVRGRLGGSNPAELQSRVQPLPLVTLDLRWQPTEACWRTGIKVDGAKSPWHWLVRWEGEIIHKQRPGETYTYAAVRHKMEQGYWEVAWGKSDQGRLDWYWQERPVLSIKVGRYF